MVKISLGYEMTYEYVNETELLKMRLTPGSSVPEYIYGMTIIRFECFLGSLLFKKGHTFSNE